jgi:demethylmenaquinone methyltransferase/2-methoxy-6-polyprenyl-1,4-benzoquinol methylase
MSNPERAHDETGRPTAERVKRIFAGLAPDYDRFNALSSLGQDRGWRKRAIELAGIRRDSSVLDLAAGTGDLTIAIAREARPARVLSTDFVPEMLEVAKQKAARYDGRTAIEFAVIDAQDIALADESFDVVTIAFGVRNLPDRAANFREVHRVLKPGGCYVVLEFSRPPFPPFRALYRFYLRIVIPNLGRLITGDRSAFDYLEHSILGFPRQAALTTELHAAGFSAVSWHNLTFGIVAVHVAVK